MRFCNAIVFRLAFFSITALLLMTMSLGSGQAEIDRAVGLAVAAQYEEALELFELELMRNPDDPLLSYYVGMTEFKLERFSRAIARFEESIGDGADFPQVFHWLAEAYLRKEMRERASATLQKGLLRFPRNRDLLKIAAEVGIEPPG